MDNGMLLVRHQDESALVKTTAHTACANNDQQNKQDDDQCEATAVAKATTCIRHRITPPFFVAILLKSRLCIQYQPGISGGEWILFDLALKLIVCHILTGVAML